MNSALFEQKRIPWRGWAAAAAAAAAKGKWHGKRAMGKVTGELHDDTEMVERHEKLHGDDLK